MRSTFHVFVFATVGWLLGAAAALWLVSLTSGVPIHGAIVTLLLGGPIAFLITIAYPTIRKCMTP